MQILAQPMNSTELANIIIAIGALGTASFGLVEASKAFWGGVNRIGFSRIRHTVSALTPTAGAHNALSQPKIIDTLQANWYNGTDLASQKAIAKTLIKLNLSVDNAPAVAAVTGVDAGTLQAIADNIATGTALTPAQSDVFGRFDLIVTALLDETYQRSDQFYRNWTKVCAMFAAVVLAIVATFLLATRVPQWPEIGKAVMVGLLATPLAPIAKDLATALTTSVNAMQLVNKKGRA
jgi:hypothetical protein